VRTAKRPARLDAEALWQYALRALARRGLSAGELREKLRARAESPEDVAAVLARLKEYGMLDDRKLAEALAASRRDNQGLGRHRVLRDLRGRRVAPAVAEKAVAAAYEGSDETALVEAYLARKYRNVDLAAHLADPRKLAAAYRRLRYAGFSGGIAIRALRRYSERAAEIDESD
jgi:regulatory protein